MLWATQSLITLTERGFIPDALIRAGIRSLLKQRLASLPLNDPAAGGAYLANFLGGLAEAPIAPLPEKANQQHYEVPAAFFQRVLGARLKYSSCWWPEGVQHLDAAETAALAETCARAELQDGQRVLELGCGWGSLSLWMAEHYPASRIVAVSNSHGQRAFIQKRAARLGLANLEVITCDMNEFDPGQCFDRVVSVEMFEHMRNWPTLFRRVADWLEPQGLFFMHVFCHRALPYTFEVLDESDWMSSHFFSGGMMPSLDLPGLIGGPLTQVRRWTWEGQHYQKTADAWLANMDSQRDALWPVLVETYGAAAAQTWWTRWRIFFMACSELFGFQQGSEWLVGHFLLGHAGAEARELSP